VTLKLGTKAGAQEPNPLTLSHDALSRGLLNVGAAGTGKSRFNGRVMVWHHFWWHYPQVVIDPIGSTIDNFLDKMYRFLQSVPENEHDQVWERIIYCDMSGKDGFVLPFPFYYLGAERSVWETSERLLEVIKKSDPGLADRPIMGYAPMHKIGVYAGMILSALGFQATELFNLLNYPEQWRDRLMQAHSLDPTVAEAVAYFQKDYIPMRPSNRERLTNPLLERLFPVQLDKRLQAIFGASQPGIVWFEVCRKKQTVLIDFRHVRGDMLRFMLLWVFSYLYEWIKSRGRSTIPFGLILDEFAQMTQKVESGDNPLAKEMDEFIQGYMRQHSIWLAISLQSPLQLDAQLQQTVLSLGSYLIGQAATREAAMLLAQAIFFPNPLWVKYTRKHGQFIRGYRGGPDAMLISEQPEFMPLSEQWERFAQTIRKLPSFSFLFRPAVSESHIGAAVKRLSIRDLDRDSVTGAYQFPDQTYLAPLRADLARQSGIPIETILKEQETRLRAVPRHRTASPAQDGSIVQPVSPPAPGNGNAAPPPQPPKRIQRRHRPGKRDE
jgi:hypothetical protein